MRLWRRAAGRELAKERKVAEHPDRSALCRYDEIVAVDE